MFLAPLALKVSVAITITSLFSMITPNTLQSISCTTNLKYSPNFFSSKPHPKPFTTKKSKSSVQTTEVNTFLTNSPLTFLLMASCIKPPHHTHLNRMDPPNGSTAHSFPLPGPCYILHLYLSRFGPKLFKPPITFATSSLPPPTLIPHPTHYGTPKNPRSLTFAFLVAPPTTNTHNLTETSLIPVHPLAFSLDIPTPKKHIDFGTQPPKNSSSAATLFSMKPLF
jgi:hypothetical protein